MAEKTELTHGNESARIRADIEQTRAAMGDTLNAIQERLSPERLKAQAKESIREATIGRVEKMARKAGDKAGDTGRGLLDVARDNPVPLALIGIGAGWLLYNSKKRTTRRPDYDRTAIGYESAYTGDGAYTAAHDSGMKARAEQVAHKVTDKVSQVRETVSAKASSTAHHLGEVASDVSHQVENAAETVARTVNDRLHHVESSAGSAALQARYKYEETPWVGAAVAIALGAAAGLAIPGTRREQDLLGETRDDLVDRAKEIGREKLQAVRRVAEGVVEETREAVREYSREEGLTSSAPSRTPDTGLGL
jgi:ElaB/YqjD/DUF883 family membrane-anchored ribosome-binding protein